MEKTCGTCGNVYETVLHCHYAENDSRYYTRATRPDVRACEHWTPRPNALEQRRQQLEQVAVQAYKWFFGAGQERWSVGREEADWMCSQLKALGVSLDD